MHYEKCELTTHCRLLTRGTPLRNGTSEGIKS